MKSTNSFYISVDKYSRLKQVYKRSTHRDHHSGSVLSRESQATLPKYKLGRKSFGILNNKNNSKFV